MQRDSARKQFYEILMAETEAPGSQYSNAQITEKVEEAIF